MIILQYAKSFNAQIRSLFTKILNETEYIVYELWSTLKFVSVLVIYNDNNYY